ncbi:hypothetical protein PCC7424_5609 (plasmid) [Gloeothece citriformis PCC 7424]|uniref:FG-GAP repeat protein n=1 Tax=Gloeothece citriformis (strain PCC 7424) TaxID=65393 RepID=B7KMZ6_GLOC7|nr:hypothetical protein [Gloeothece citriformis]ACK74168.1 hypothetical protein PCC7424_5609 [Gloeothece citriformis PCC 7424]
MKTLKRLLIAIGFATTLGVSQFSVIKEAYSQTSGLRGKFDGKNLQEARIRSVGDLAVAVEVNGQQWFASRRGEVNFSKIIGCTVGNFNRDSYSDIACLYDYGNFDVGIWVLLSDGRNFNSSIWWRSGQNNFNPEAIVPLAGGVRVVSIDNNSDGLNDIKIRYRYPNDIITDLVFYSDGTKFYR